MNRDTRPLKLRTKYMLGWISILAVVVCVAIGAPVDALDSNSLAAACIAIGAIGGVTTYAQGQADKNGGGP